MKRTIDGAHTSRRQTTRRWAPRLALLAVLAAGAAAPGAEGEELLFSVKSEVQRGEVIELVGPTLPTEGIRIILHALEPPSNSDPYRGLAVLSVEPGRIVARAPWTGSPYWWTSEGHELEIVVSRWIPGAPDPFTEWYSAGPVRFLAPEPLRVEPFNARAGDVVSIHGRALGYDPPPSTSPDRARVLIGGVDAEILSWEPEVATVRLSDATPSGLLAVNVHGAFLGGGVMVGEPSVWSKGRRSSLRIFKQAGPKSAKVRVRAARYDEEDGILFLKAFGHTTRWRTASACTPVGGTWLGDCSDPVHYAVREWRLLRMSIPVDLAATPAPFTVRAADVDPDLVTFEYAFSGSSPRRFPKRFPVRPLSDWAVHVHSVDDRWIAGSFSGLVAHVVSGDPEVVQGSFRIRRRRPRRRRR